MLENIKSKYIIKEIFENIKNKRKLNIIKYNKRLLVRLNINKEEFEIYLILKEFNNKYNTNIEDIDKNELNLIDNKISDISVLEKVNFKVTL